jgi:hypothetical protein
MDANARQHESRKKEIETSAIDLSKKSFVLCEHTRFLGVPRRPADAASPRVPGATADARAVELERSGEITACGEQELLSALRLLGLSQSSGVGPDGVVEIVCRWRKLSFDPVDLETLIRLHTVEGYWKNSAELYKERCAPIRMPDAIGEMENREKVFATILAIAILRTHYASDHGSWGILEEKSLTWLTAQKCQFNIETLIGNLRVTRVEPAVIKRLMELGNRSLRFEKAKIERLSGWNPEDDEAKEAPQIPAVVEPEFEEGEPLPSEYQPLRRIQFRDDDGSDLGEEVEVPAAETREARQTRISENAKAVSRSLVRVKEAITNLEDTIILDRVKEFMFVVLDLRRLLTCKDKITFDDHVLTVREVAREAIKGNRNPEDLKRVEEYFGYLEIGRSTRSELEVLVLSLLGLADRVRNDPDPEEVGASDPLRAEIVRVSVEILNRLLLAALKLRKILGEKDPIPHEVGIGKAALVMNKIAQAFYLLVRMFDFADNDLTVLKRRCYIACEMLISNIGDVLSMATQSGTTSTDDEELRRVFEVVVDHANSLRDCCAPGTEWVTEETEPEPDSEDRLSRASAKREAKRKAPKELGRIVKDVDKSIKDALRKLDPSVVKPSNKQGITEKERQILTELRDCAIKLQDLFADEKEIEQDKEIARAAWRTGCIAQFLACLIQMDECGADLSIQCLRLCCILESTIGDIQSALPTNPDAGKLAILMASREKVRGSVTTLISELSAAVSAAPPGQEEPGGTVQFGIFSEDMLTILNDLSLKNQVYLQKCQLALKKAEARPHPG